MGHGRAFSQVTVLGRLMLEHRVTVHGLSIVTDINARKLSDYLAARTEPTVKHLRAICRAFHVEPEVLVTPGNEWRLVGED